MLEINCVGERIHLLPEKAVFWPREKMLVIADLHLGKPAAFRQSGVPVPENTTVDDLARLGKILDATGSERVMTLGDFFHATAGLQPEMLDAFGAWRKKHSRLKMSLALGNHDKRAGRPPESWNIEISEAELIPPFLFQHEPGKSSGAYVLSGHIHPAISISERFGSGIRAPCFLFGPHCAILPAFGSFTGMKNVRPSKSDRVFAVGIGEIVEISGHHTTG